MHRSLPPLTVASLALAALALAVALGASGSAPTSAEEPARPHHIVYVHVSGEGSQAKAWYDGGPPSGTLVQTVLNHFASQGYRFAAIGSSGSASLTQVVASGATAPTLTADAAEREPFFALLLER
jgi:hypothetical protein